MVVTFQLVFCYAQPDLPERGVMTPPPLFVLARKKCQRKKYKRASTYISQHISIHLYLTTPKRARHDDLTDDGPDLTCSHVRVPPALPLRPVGGTSRRRPTLLHPTTPPHPPPKVHVEIIAGGHRGCAAHRLAHACATAHARLARHRNRQGHLPGPLGVRWGLYELNPVVTDSLQAPGFINPWSLYIKRKTCVNVCFHKLNLYRYSAGGCARLACARTSSMARRRWTSYPARGSGITHARTRVLRRFGRAGTFLVILPFAVSKHQLMMTADI
jgi:hypothetical protein